MGTLSQEEMKTIFAKTCRKYPSAKPFLEHGTFHQSGKGNIVCRYHNSEIVVDQRGAYVGGGGAAALSRETRKLEEQRQLQLLQERVKVYITQPAFMERLEYSEMVEKAEVLKSTAGCYIKLTLKENAPFRPKPQFQIKSDAKSPESVAEQINKTEMVASLSDRYTEDLSMRAGKSLHEYLESVKIHWDEQYIYQGLPKADARYAKKLNDEHYLEGKWSISHMAKIHNSMTFSFAFANIDFTYDYPNDNLEINHSERLLARKIAQIRKTKRAYTKIYNAVKASMPNKDVPEHAVTLTLTGDKGKPAYNINLKFYGMDYKTTVSLSKEATDMFQKEIKKKVKEAEKSYKREQERSRIRLEKQGLYSGILAQAVCCVAEANSDFITENIICKILRGLKLNTERTYTPTDMGGKFRLISDSDIRGTIRKLVRVGALSEWRVDGTYNDYDALQPGDRNLMECITHAGISHFGKDKKFPEYTDLDWERYLEKTDPETLKDSYWMKLIPVFDHTALYCVKPELFTSFFSHAPEAFKEYLAVAGSMEEGSKKKLIKSVSAAIK